MHLEPLTEEELSKLSTTVYDTDIGKGTKKTSKQLLNELNVRYAAILNSCDPKTWKEVAVFVGSVMETPSGSRILTYIKENTPDSNITDKEIWKVFAEFGAYGKGTAEAHEEFMRGHTAGYQLGIEDAQQFVDTSDNSSDALYKAGYDKGYQDALNGL